ncbi:hypothetical protein [Sphingomonas sp. UV9]|uniref:hypothetical protein n=1 Tax=Sphingomonas sp. UV9 TaxID=1851410 RepID=UPI0013E8AEE2|nr:hypothetical protein [Sphingomonas sp. UV9]
MGNYNRQGLSALVAEDIGLVISYWGGALGGDDGAGTIDTRSLHRFYPAYAPFE